MVRSTTEAAFESYTTEALAEFINDAAPVAANLDDDYASARDAIRAEVEAALAVFKRRNEPVTDGGSVPVDEFVDDEDDYRAHVTDEDTDDYKIRHARNVRTRVVDGEVVHYVTESYDRDADVDSLSFSGRVSCAAHGRTGRTRGDDHTVRHACDECAFEVAVGYRRDEDETGAEAPTFYRAVVPDAILDEPDVDLWSHVDDDADEDDVATIANMVRTLSLDRYVGAIDDAAYVSAEYDDDHNKTEDAYLDIRTCDRCGDDVEAPALRKHAHFGDVCRACEDATVWSVDDADLPDDVVERMGDHKTFSASNIVRYLKDVAFFGDFVASVNDDVDAFDGIKTGKGGERGVYGGGRKGTGLRRPNGAAHGQAHFRTVLRDLVDTGLVDRTDGDDTDVDDPNAHFVITDKGRDVLSELARCETCGDTLDVFVRHSTYKVGRRTKRSRSLTIGCKACGDADGTTAGGAMVLDSSGETHYEQFATVDDA
jgi:hypothetical protein